MSFPLVEALLKFIFWYRVKLYKHFKWIFSLGNKKKLHNARCGEYGGCSTCIILCFQLLLLGISEHWTLAPTCMGNMLDQLWQPFRWLMEFDQLLFTHQVGVRADETYLIAFSLRDKILNFFDSSLFQLWAFFFFF